MWVSDRTNYLCNKASELKIKLGKQGWLFITGRVKMLQKISGEGFSAYWSLNTHFPQEVFQSKQQHKILFDDVVM